MEPPSLLIPDAAGMVDPRQIARCLASRPAWLLLIILAVFLSGAGGAGGSSAGGSPETESPAFVLAEGELVSLSSDVCVLRDVRGKGLSSFTVDGRTTIVDIVREGDPVVVYASPEGLARSIFKALCEQDADCFPVDAPEFRQDMVQ
jgi:hypothetical protein